MIQFLACCFVAICLLTGRHTSVATKVDVSSSGAHSASDATRRLQNSCEEDGYADRTLKLAYEQPFAGLFLDSEGQTVYELSSVTIGQNGMAYAVCDSSWAISMFDPKLQTFHTDNMHIGDPFARNDADGVSAYESIFMDDQQGAGGNQTMYVVREAVEDENGMYHAVIEELQVTKDGTDYTIKEKCPSEYTFSSENKGFEGAAFIRSSNNEIFVIGLCEGNFCGNNDGNTDSSGNGVSIVMKKEILQDGSCQWSTYRELEIPKTADFTDYSDITISDQGRVAITSQEDSKVWIGKLDGQNADGLWDIDDMAFDMTQLHVYGFPRDHHCNIIFCNVEGKAKKTSSKHFGPLRQLEEWQQILLQWQTVSYSHLSILN